MIVAAPTEAPKEADALLFNPFSTVAAAAAAAAEVSYGPTAVFEPRLVLSLEQRASLVPTIIFLLQPAPATEQLAADVPAVVPAVVEEEKKEEPKPAEVRLLSSKMEYMIIEHLDHSNS